MKYKSQTPLSFVILLFYSLILVSGCTENDYTDDHTPTTSGSRRSEKQVIKIVQDYIKAESESRTESRSVFERTMCTEQRASYDMRCKPCAPGSSNYCIDEWKTKLVEVPGRCRFPPSKNATWSAVYEKSHGTWTVESDDPYETGRNHWKVDDQSADVLSGYCVYR